MQINNEQAFITEWEKLLATTSNKVRQEIAAIVSSCKSTLADDFYKFMLRDEKAKVFIDHQMVRERLHASMQQWVEHLFCTNDTPHDIYQLQHRVGAAHARIQIPIELVTQGARLLRQEISWALIDSQLHDTELVSATHFVCAVIDIALDAMTSAYIADSEKMARSDEAYKMFAYGQNLVAERERQRASLHEWAHQLLIRHLNNQHEPNKHRLGHSDFGIWFEHKATALFEESPELGRIRRYIEETDGLLADLDVKASDQASQLSHIKEIDQKIDRIDFLMNEMFEHFIQMESGRDALTHLLNRRFLPSILAKEMLVARRTNTLFSLVLFDIDHFKKINDTWGHAAGDMVLQQSAEIISRNVRAGDFVFRYGGEEILVVLVEITPDKAWQVAEKIRSSFEASPLRTGDADSINVTISAGIACFNGHPDFELLLRKADQALYQAKESGRNRCVMAAQ